MLADLGNLVSGSGRVGVQGGGDGQCTRSEQQHSVVGRGLGMLADGFSIQIRLCPAADRASGRCGFTPAACRCLGRTNASLRRRSVALPDRRAWLGCAHAAPP